MAFHPSIAEALRLTRAGSLVDATALIRDMLAGGGTTPASSLAYDPAALFPKQTRESSRPVESASRFEARSYTGPAGRIEYMLYRPAAATLDMPLVVMLHGCTQSPEDFARGTGMNRLAEEVGFLVAYPRQTQAANMQKCWNWFQPGHQRRDQGEPALIAGLVGDIIRDEQVDASRVYVTGLSAGGAAAAIMADTYPDLFAAVGIHSGLACGAARDLPSALVAMKNGAGRSVTSSPTNGRYVPVITFHGDRDTTVGEVNARDIVRAATVATGTPVSVTVETGEIDGRRYTRASSRDAADRVLIEQWTIAGAGHAWSGGDAGGSYTDDRGPNASRAMIDFFLQHRAPKA